MRAMRAIQHCEETPSFIDAFLCVLGIFEFEIVILPILGVAAKNKGKRTWFGKKTGRQTFAREQKDHRPSRVSMNAAVVSATMFPPKYVMCGKSAMSSVDAISTCISSEARDQKAQQMKLFDGTVVTIFNTSTTIAHTRCVKV